MSYIGITNSRIGGRQTLIGDVDVTNCRIHSVLEGTEVRTHSANFNNRLINDIERIAGTTFIREV